MDYLLDLIQNLVSLDRIATISDGVAFLTGALVGLAFMFQGRHHNIYTHEKEVRDEVAALAKRLKVERDFAKIKSQIKTRQKELGILRIRYACALLAFIFLMLSVLLLTLAFFLLSFGFETASAWLFLTIVSTVVLSFCFHIGGDLIPAQISQSRIRSETKRLLKDISFPNE